MMSESVNHDMAGSDAPRDDDLDTGRRTFLRAMGIGATGAALLGAGSAAAQQTVTGPGDPNAPKTEGQSANLDVDILQFALNLEYLEAEFYLRAAFGRGLAPRDVTGGSAMGRDEMGEVRGGRRVNFTTRNIRLYAEELAREEELHVQLLRRALGDFAIPRPLLDIENAFTTLARDAGLIGPNQRFDPFENENNFLLASYVFEDVGVTAYQGAAPLLTSRAVLAAAAGLLAVEAYHAATVRTVLFSRDMFRETNLISNLRRRLSGRDDERDIGGPTEARIVPVDSDGLTFARSTRQVLNIVLGGQGRRDGLFFPQGLNGSIRE